MVDFFSLGSSGGPSTDTDPRKIFNALVKPDGVNELYASQGDVLEKWFESRSLTDRIVKLPTGGGKSLVGLLIAQSTLNELRLPALYVVPTRQLVKQVCDEASRFGLSAEPYVSAKEGIPGAVLDARAVCVATYEAVFNGKSRFGNASKVSEIGQVGVIILDDAHAAFESVWDSFSFVIERKHHPDLYQELCAKFRKSFEEIGRVWTYDDVVAGKDLFVMEVPHWEWTARIPEVGTTLQAYGPEKIDLFSWPHIRDELHACHALVSRSAFNIVPLVPFVDKCLAFSQAKRRVYMSATIANDSEVVRTFGASAKSVVDPIVAASLAGVGERMILAPALTQLPSAVSEKQILLELCADLKAAQKNTLILTRSFEGTKDWGAVALAASKTEESESLIDRLRTERGLTIAVPRRYDGIDLPGEACRLLVLDGLPYGSSDYDSWRISTLSLGIANSQLAQRIEQAIGRGTRGTSDYCVVILTGKELVYWLGRSANQSFLSSSTKRQLEIGLRVSAAVTTGADFKATAWQCLNRDQGWRAYHAREMASAAVPDSPDLKLLQLWEAERRGVEELRIRSFTAALNAFDGAIDLAEEAVTKGWFHQLKARTANQAGNAPQGDEWQSKAYRLNMRLTPPRGQVRVTRMDPPGQQAVMVCNRLADYMHPSVALALYNELSSYLTPFSTSNQFEEALEKLFSWLGFSSSRPDHLYKQGPDNLVIAEDGAALIIEAKSRRKPKNRFTKSLHGQVLSHENWFNANYSPQQRRKRVVLSPTTESEANAGTHGTAVLTFDALTSIFADGRTLLSECSTAPKEQCFAIAAQRISELRLSFDAIIARLTVFSDAGTS